MYGEEGGDGRDGQKPCAEEACPHRTLPMMEKNSIPPRHCLSSNLFFISATRAFRSLFPFPPTLQEKKANVNRAGGGKMTPLHTARSGEIITALLTHGAKPASFNFRGCNALMEQVSERGAACVSALLAHPKGRAITNA